MVTLATLLICAKKKLIILLDLRPRTKIEVLILLQLVLILMWCQSFNLRLIKIPGLVSLQSNIKAVSSLLALLPSSSNTQTMMDLGSCQAQVNMVSAPPAKNLSLGNGNLSISTWILHTSATDHIYTSLSFFTSFRSYKLVIISLPNDNQLVSHLSGLFPLHQILFSILFYIFLFFIAI